MEKMGDIHTFSIMECTWCHGRSLNSELLLYSRCKIMVTHGICHRSDGHHVDSRGLVEMPILDISMMLMGERGVTEEEAKMTWYICSFVL